MVARSETFGTGRANVLRKMWALLPISFGACTIVIILVAGEVLGSKMSKERALVLKASQSYSTPAAIIPKTTTEEGASPKMTSRPFSWPNQTMSAAVPVLELPIHSSNTSFTLPNTMLCR